MDIKSIELELSQLQAKGSTFLAKSHTDLTTTEVAEVERITDRITQLKGFLRAAQNGAGLTALPGEDWNASDAFGAKSGHLDTSATAVKAALRAGGQKSLVATGSSVVPLDLHSEVILKGRETPVGVVNFLTTTTRSSSSYRFIREATIDNQAAFVETGANKPVSTYEVESVDGTLKFLAHVSQPVDQDTLDDAANLEAYLTQAMTRGIYEKLGGSAVAAMQTAVGAQPVVAGSEPLASIAAGQLAVNTLGYETGLVILHRTDYLELVTTRNSSGAFDLGLGGALATGATGPAETIFGVPVLISSAATLGQAIVLDPSAVGISVDNQGVRVKWDESGALFDANQKRVRVELKAAIDVVKPAAIALVDLAAV
ncbi:phage major capsid protein [Microbacterium sp. AK031]|uniref:phage major capsid protein n=1 Tax=Microbacterium sp. AK031 TaxID=2723076 RepID=UPI0021693030|nr:phage major capsid protein [Microbacterium sp. AK031]MCS3844810.1 HK97 family phage major capsid protein [Microbacterium sp. AK031]